MPFVVVDGRYLAYNSRAMSHNIAPELQIVRLTPAWAEQVGPEGVAKVAAGIGQLMYELDPVNFPDTPIPDERMAELMTSPDRCQIAAIEDGEAIGAVTPMILVEPAIKIGWIGAMVVRHDRQNLGIGKLLGVEAKAYLREQGVPFILLENEEERHNSDFYIRLGGEILEDTHLIRIPLDQRGAA